MKNFEREIVEIIQRVLDSENLVLLPTDGPATVTEWDSLAHIAVVAELESSFSIMFTSEEIEMADSVSGIIAIVHGKISLPDS